MSYVRRRRYVLAPDSDTIPTTVFSSAFQFRLGPSFNVMLAGPIRVRGTPVIGVTGGYNLPIWAAIILPTRARTCIDLHWSAYRFWWQLEVLSAFQSSFRSHPRASGQSLRNIEVNPITCKFHVST